MLDKALRIGILYDFFGALLTEKQQQCVEWHYLHDLSLAEMADNLGVSRQAVHDILRRSEQLLEEYEAKLQLAARHQSQRQKVQEAYSLLTGLPEAIREVPQIQQARSVLTQLLE